MLTKALWMKEFKQVRTILWFMLGLIVIKYPIATFMTLENWREIEKEQGQNNVFGFTVDEWMVQNLFTSGFTKVLLIVLIVLLAGLLIGAERNTRRNDFTFALPFPRRNIFMTKWLIGVVPFTVFYKINYFMAYILVQTSEYSQFMTNLTHYKLLILPLLGYIALFSLAMIIGTITGEMISQMVLTFIFTIFPIGFYLLIISFIHIHTGAYSNLTEPTFVMNLIWPMYIVDPVFITELNWVYPTIAIIVFTVASVLLYERNQIEYNGEFLIFKKLVPIFKIGIVVCFALLGGIIVSGIASYGLNTAMSIVMYWFGLVLFAFLSYLMTKRLMKMNVTVKNK